MSDFIVFTIAGTVSLAVLAFVFWSYRKMREEEAEKRESSCGDDVDEASSILTLEIRENKNGRFFWRLVSKSMLDDDRVPKIKSMSTNKKFGNYDEARSDCMETFGPKLYEKLVLGVMS